MTDILIGCILDLIFGDPYWFPHPVKLMGRLIAFEERFARRLFKGKSLYFAGFLIVLINISLAYFIPYFILKALSFNRYIFHAVNIFFIYTLVAAKNLRDEAVKVLNALNISLEEARYKLSFIVGRDTKNLDEGEIIRATVETVAENTSDGVIAPLFYLLFGTPFGFVYKMVNTMDSMLGYMKEEYRYIGFFPAKTDDVFNFITARITGFLMILSGIFSYDVIYALRIMIRDRKNHKSPNCAYPEGAVAGLLKVRLGGDNYYFGELVKKPTIGDAVRELEKEDILRTIKIMFSTELIFIIIALVLKIYF
ncbi:MAG: adenosylcobinamide-phosphate synthase CbiB [Caloramator sp.]|nr:adenosylcobinamide-phosphate synthase CbiB [Caloramator sp.]